MHIASVFTTDIKAGLARTHRCDGARNVPASLPNPGSMATADQLAEAISTADKLVRQQVKLGLDEKILRQTQVDCLTRQISALGTLTPAVSLQLNATVLGGGWNEANRHALAAAIYAGERAAVEKRLNQKGQDCSTFELYLTRADWAIIDDSASPMIAKIAVVQKRCKSMGLNYPNERTKGRIAKLLRYRGLAGHVLTTEEWYDLIERVGKALDKNKKHGRGTLQEYPADPNDLPAELACAFGDDPPLYRDVAELGACAAGIRKSHDAWKKTWA